MTQLTVMPRPYSGPTPVSPPAFGPPGYPPEPPSNGSALDARQILRALRRRWWVVVLGGLLGAGGAMLWAWKQNTLYLGSALVQLVQSRENLTEGIVGREGDASERPFAQLGLPPVELLRSRAVIGAVVDSEALGLRVTTAGFPLTVLQDVSFTPGAPDHSTVDLVFSPGGVRVAGRETTVPYGQPVTIGALRFTVAARPDVHALSSRPRLTITSREEAIARMTTAFRGTARPGSTLIDLVYISPDSGLARRVVNRAAMAFRATAAQSIQQQAQRRRVFIGEQIARADSQMFAAERALSAFRMRVQAFSAAEKFTEQQRDLLTLQLRQRDLQSSRDMAASVLRGFMTNAPDARAGATRMLASTTGLGTNPIVSALVTKLVGYETARTEITSGTQAYTANHPSVLRFDSLITATQAALMSTLQSQTAVLDVQLRDVEAQRAARERELRTLPVANAEEAHLLQNVAVLRDQEIVLRGEFQKARIAEAVAVGPVEILELESHPRALAATNARVVVIATLLGLALGTAGGVGPVLADRSLRRRVDVEAALRLPVLATVPRVELPTLARRSWRPKSPRTARIGASDTAQRRGVALAALDPRGQPGAEAYRHLRATLFSTRYGQAPRRVLVTSALPAEGKTSVAVNLATTLAQQGRRVLLIDGDLRNAKLHRILDLPAGPGLSDVLLARELAFDALQQAVVGGLFVLTAGTPDPSASDLLGGPRLRALLNDCAQQFDVVVIDSPPVLAVSDATVLGAQADAVLMVVRAGQTAGAEAGDAVRQLVQGGASLAGAVFNDPDGEIQDEGRSGYYYYATRSA